MRGRVGAIHGPDRTGPGHAGKHGASRERTIAWRARHHRSMPPIARRHASVCGKTRPVCRRQAPSAQQPRRPGRTSGRQGRRDPPAAGGGQRQAQGPAPGGLAPGLCGVAGASPAPPEGRGAAVTGPRAALWCAGAWHGWGASEHASLGAGRPTGPPPSPGTPAPPSRWARHTAASMPSAPCRRASPDRGAAAAPASRDSPRPRAGRRWGHALPAARRRLVVSRHCPGAVLADGGRGSHG
jgi:hypothetical protein